MTTTRSAAFLAVCVLLSGCGTLTQGSTQEIAFSSDPPGAECDLWQNGKWHVATLTTPATISVSKTKYDMEMSCSKAGYRNATTTLISGYGLGTFGNVILGGAIGWAIDSSTGSDNKYPSSAKVSLAPLPAASPTPKTSAIVPPES